MLFVGCMEARDEELPWFILQLRRVCGRLGLGSKNGGWNDVMMVMERWWFVERIHGGRGRRIWKKVEREFLNPR